MDNASLAEGEKGAVFTTASYALLFSSLAFMLLGAGFSGNIANGIGFPAHSISVLMLLIIGIDKLYAVPDPPASTGPRQRLTTINILERGGERGVQPLHLPLCAKKFNALKAATH
ncbi:MAG: hypothetical protein R2818_07815 [Flavobacteriales bacterium]